MPAVTPASASTHRAGGVQMGPFAVSQASPSAAAAMQVPSLSLGAFWQKESAMQSTAPPSMVPQGCVAVAVAAWAQTFPASVLQYRPKRPSHRLPPSVRSQLPPRVARATQEPSVPPSALLPRQVNPGPQTLLLLQAPAAATGATHW